MKKALVVLLILFSSSALASESIIFQSHFDDGFYNWNAVGSDWTLVSPGFGDYGQAAQVRYSLSGTRGYVLEKILSYDYLPEVMVEFDFRVDFADGHQPYGGCKFLKIFGVQNGDDNYANATFSINFYDNNQFKEISYGAGTQLTARDTQAAVRYNGTLSYNFPTPLPNFVLSTSYITDHLTTKGWHKFKAYMKYNSNDSANGEYRVWFDGVERLHVTNVVNRHNDNSPFIGKVNFGGYNGSTVSPFEPWYLTIDNVKISIPAAAPPVPPGKREKTPGEDKNPLSNGGKK
jgi:hypothetical protein